MTKYIQKKTLLEIAVLLCAPCIIAVMLLIVYAIKGVYPFGNGNIAYYDMAQSYIPLYTHTYDVLHGTKGLFYDWFSGGGVSMQDTMGLCVLNPFNLFFFFVKREMILEAMSWFLVLKLSFMAFSMSFFGRKMYKNLPAVWIITAGVAYAGCGYVLQYYSNIFFLDIAAIFPLLIYAFFILLHERRGSLFIIIFSVCLISNLQFSVMICFYLILRGMIYIKKRLKEERTAVILNLAICTCTALLISSFSIIPTALAFLKSSRVGNTSESSYLKGLLTVFCDMQEQKNFMLYGGEIACGAFIAFLVFNIRNIKEKIKKYSENIFMIAVLAIPILLENVNTLWHVVGYVHFPMRFGYMLSFELLFFVLKFANEFINEQQILSENKSKILRLLFLVSIAMIPCLFMVICGFDNLFLQYGIRNLANYKAYWLIFLLLLLFYTFVFLSKNRKYVGYICGLMIIIQVALGLYGFIAPKQEYSAECADTFIARTEQINSIETEKGNTLNRIKDRDALMNANYGFLINESTYSNWTMAMEPEMQRELKRLGYSTNYLRQLDNGGTLFSDMLLNMTDVISENKLDENQYQQVGIKDDLGIYRLRYTLPIGITVSAQDIESDKEYTNDLDIQEENVDSIYDYQNFLFDLLTEEEDLLIRKIPLEQAALNKTQDEKWGFYRYVVDIEIEENEMLYFYSNSANDGMFSLFVNSQAVKIPYLDVRGNYAYPAPFRNGVIELGNFEKEKVQVVIETTFGDLNNVSIGAMKVSDLEGLAKKMETKKAKVNVDKGTVKIQKECEKEGFLFLPITYHSGLVAEVNGEKKEISSCWGDAFAAIPVEKGMNEITIKYIPEGIYLGIVLSIIGIALFPFIRFAHGKLIGNISYILFQVIFYGILILLYVLPVLTSIITFLYIGKYLNIAS